MLFYQINMNYKFSVKLLVQIDITSLNVLTYTVSVGMGIRDNETISSYEFFLK